MNSKSTLSRILALFCLSFAIHQTAHADTTLTGSFTSDDQLVDYSFASTSTQTYNFFTTSYGGGSNLDGSVSSAGGFVPVLTLFNANPNGTVIGPSTTGGAADPMTGLSNDAFLTETLGPGSYLLVLSEFPNVAIGNLPDGFLFAGQGNFTGGLCGGSGSFVETDISPCAQRSANYALNVSTAVTPEPATWMLMLPAAGLFLVAGRRLA